MEAAQKPEPSRIGLIAEVAAFVGFALGSKALMSLVAWRYAGPISLLTTLAVLTVWLRFRGTGWREMGLVPLRGWKAKLLVLPKAGLTLLAFALVVALTTVAGPAVGLDFLKGVSTGVDERWGEVKGSLPHLLLWLGIVWSAAAFGEEMFFRGYLITRLLQIFGSGWAPKLFAVLIPALIFGYGHFYYQGLRGAIVTCGIGLAFGAMFLLFRRNLWPMILLHGVIDTLAFTGIYLGLE